MINEVWTEGNKMEHEQWVWTEGNKMKREQWSRITIDVWITIIDSMFQFIQFSSGENICNWISSKFLFATTWITFHRFFQFHHFSVPYESSYPIKLIFWIILVDFIFNSLVLRCNLPFALYFLVSYQCGINITTFYNKSSFLKSHWWHVSNRLCVFIIWLFHMQEFKIYIFSEVSKVTKSN